MAANFILPHCVNFRTWISCLLRKHAQNWAKGAMGCYGSKSSKGLRILPSALVLTWVYPSIRALSVVVLDAFPNRVWMSRRPAARYARWRAWQYPKKGRGRLPWRQPL